MSSCYGSIGSMNTDVLSCLLVVVFLSQKCFFRSMLRTEVLYEFLLWLRREYEHRRAKLFARGRVPISEVLFEIYVED
jgi:hypothetical protein